MLMYNALTTPCFRSIKLRTRRPNCPACGTVPQSERVGHIKETDYVAFCGGPRPDWVGRGVVDADDTERRISAKVRERLLADRFGVMVTLYPQALKATLSTATKQVRIIDVRPPTEFGICHLQGSISQYLDPCS